MAFIGSLITTVKANTSQFRKGLKKAAAATKKLRKQLKGMAISGAKFAVAIGAVAVAGLVLYTLKAFKAIDATKKLSDEIGIATQDLVAYQLAAGLSGTTTEVLNKALQRMARTVGEARAGISTGTKALEDFGIQVEELDKMTSAEIFEEFSQRIANIKDPMERAAKAALIFGRAGQKLLNFLALGKVGLAEVKAEAEALGLAFNAVDARKVELANDAILKMQTVATGLGNELAISVAPFITALADEMAKFIKESGGIDDIVQVQLKNLSVGIANTIDVIKLGEAAWKLFSATARIALIGLAIPLGLVEQGIRVVIGLLTDTKIEDSFLIRMAEELADLAEKDFKAAEKAFKDFERSTTSTKVAAAFNEIQKASQKIAENLENSKTSQEGFTAATKANLEAMKEQQRIAKELEADRKKVIADAEAIFRETRTPLEKVNAEIQRILELLAKGVDERLTEALDRKLKELKDKKEDIEASLEKEIKVELPKEIADEVAKKIEEVEEKKKKKEREAGFRQIDVKNINVKGLSTFGGVEQKQLTELERSNIILNDISNKIESGGAVAQ